MVLHCVSQADWRCVLHVAALRFLVELAACARNVVDLRVVIVEEEPGGRVVVVVVALYVITFACTPCDCISSMITFACTPCDCISSMIPRARTVWVLALAVAVWVLALAVVAQRALAPGRALAALAARRAQHRNIMFPNLAVRWLD